MQHVEIVADSINITGARIITAAITVPRIILAEVNTHKSVAKNSASSRAIPVAKKIERIENTPFIPLRFGKNKRGMQDTGESISEADKATEIWIKASEAAIEAARALSALEVHKQVANRTLEPYEYTRIVATGNADIIGYGFENFLALRDSELAQPEIELAAKQLRKAIEDSEPQYLLQGQWHTPFVSKEEKELLPEIDVLKVSAARVARSSYYVTEPKSVEEEIELANDLIRDRHMSPFEQVARAHTIDPNAVSVEDVVRYIEFLNGNEPLPPLVLDVRHLRGFIPFRSFLDHDHFRS